MIHAINCAAPQDLTALLASFGRLEGLQGFEQMGQQGQRNYLNYVTLFTQRIINVLQRLLLF
jgi:hypothetical protein